MSIKFTIVNQKNYLKVKASGKDDNLEEVFHYANSILKEASKNKSKRILSDERELVYEISTLDTFTLAEEAAKHCRHLMKIAIVCNSRYLEEGKFYETVASNRGLIVRVTDNYDEAEKWLLK